MAKRSSSIFDVLGISTSAVRRASSAELAVLGKGPTATTYVLKDVTGPITSSPLIPKRQFDLRRIFERSGAKVTSLEQRGKKIGAGLLASGHVVNKEQREAGFSKKARAFYRELALTTAKPSQATPAQIEHARRTAGLTNAEFERLRHGEKNRTASSPFRKNARGRYEYVGVRSYWHGFINAEGARQSAVFSGSNLTAMQEYRDAYSEALRLGNNGPLKDWERRHVGGVYDDLGNRVYPATDAATIKAARARMTTRERQLFEKQSTQSEEASELSEAA
jgi:hypothetical protein